MKTKADLGVRASLAWDLIRSHPNVAGIQDGEDTSGRSKVRLQTALEIVERSFDIADIFCDKAEGRGEVDYLSAEEVVIQEAIRHRLKSDVEFGRAEKDTWDIEKVVERANVALARIGAEAAADAEKSKA